MLLTIGLHAQNDPLSELVEMNMGCAEIQINWQSLHGNLFLSIIFVTSTYQKKTHYFPQ